MTTPARMAEPTDHPYRPRLVMLLGTALLVFNAFFGTYAYVVVQALIWTQTSLLRGPVVMLCLVVLLNALLVRLARRSGLSQGEMLALYAMIAVGTCAGGLGFVQILVNQLAGVFYYATPSNHWKETLWPHIPGWLAPRDPAVIDGFFRGRSNLYSLRVLAGWAPSVLAWSAFIFSVFWVLLCATALLRRRWVDEERLTFPLVALPLAMTGSTAPFWQNRWMWAGFLLAGALESVNSFNFLLPWVPSIPIKPVGPNILDAYFTMRPWHQMGMFRLAFYPWVIGIAYLISLDISFSCWFLYLCVKLSYVITAMLGISEGGGGAADRAPFIREQGLGAFVCMAALSLWSARGTLRRAWKDRLRQDPTISDELMPPRLAIGGCAVGLLFLAGFLVAAGLSVGVALVFALVWVAFSVTLARIVSEAGAGWAWAPNWSATQFAADSFGASSLTRPQLAILFGYTEWTNDMRDNPMPQQMGGVRLAQAAEGGRVAPRAFFWPLVWAAAFGILCAFWAHLHIYYTFGAASGKVRPFLASMGMASFQHASTMIKSPPDRDVPGMIAAGVGAVVVLALTALRQRLLWWPFHPVGYALATTSSMDYMWFPFFLAWLLKLLILRYGGIRTYRTALPFFLGLILGDYVIPALWGIFGMLSGSQQYMAFPH